MRERVSVSMDAEDAPRRSRPLPWLLLGAALSVAVAAYFVLNTRLPGRSFTLVQEGKVRAFGHQGVVKMGSNCADCHR